MKEAVLGTMATPLLATGMALSAEAGPPNDLDSDGVSDVSDICLLDPLSPNPNFCDTDMDGYGSACDADLNNDGVVGGPDLGLFSAQLGGPPGPSGLSCAGTIPCP